MFGIGELKRKRAYKDEISVDFVKSIKARREAMGLSQPKLAGKVGVQRGSIAKYELGIQFPCLNALIKLAIFFGADISESLNWKCWNNEINLADIRHKLKRYGITHREADNIDSICGKSSLAETLRGYSRGSVKSLAGLVNLIEEEEQLEQMREEILAPKKRKQEWYKVKWTEM